MYSYLKFAKQTFVMMGLNALGTIQGIIFLPIITKILGAENYGIWTQVNITMCLLVPLTLLGLTQALARFLPGQEDKEVIQESTYSSLLIVACVVLVTALFLMTFSKQIAFFLHFAPIFIKFISVIIIFESLNTVLLTVVLYRREVEKYFWFSATKMFGETGLVIASVLMGRGLFGAIISFLIVRAILFLALSFYVIKKIGIKLPNFSLVKKYLNFGLPTITNNISYIVVTSADRYVIGFFLGMGFVGYYAPAYSLGMILLFFIIPTVSILAVVLPKFFDENNFVEVKNYLSNSFKYFLLIMIPATFGISVLSYQLLALFSTKDIAAKALFVVPFIATSMFIYGIICFFTQILNLFKRTKLIAIIWAVSAFLNLGLNIIFVPRFGIIAAAAITFLSYLCALILICYYSLKEFQFDIRWDFVIKGFVASTFMAVLIWCLNPGSIMSVALSIIFGVLIYGILMFLFRAVGKKEINFFKKLVYEMVFLYK